MSDPSAIITLTTDFGEGSRYVAAMKGVILSINPEVRLVDLSHAVGPQDIRGGAMVLAETALYFPPGTIHLAVVDPGVGSSRGIIYAAMADQHFVAPDNGLLSSLASRRQPTKIIGVEDSQFWRSPVSSTFHGRDIMAPVAARLSLGLPPEQLGQPLADLVRLDWPEVHVMPRSIQGEVVEIDSFGNLITNITQEQLSGVPTDESVTIHCDDHETHGIFNTYSDQPAMTLIAVVGSSGRLELAIVEESAKVMLGVPVGTAVKVSW